MTEWLQLILMFLGGASILLVPAAWFLGTARSPSQHLRDELARARSEYARAERLQKRAERSSDRYQGLLQAQLDAVAMLEQRLAAQVSDPDTTMAWWTN